jgi:hypothetical protein
VKCLRLGPALGSFGSLGPVVDLSREVMASADLFVGDFGVRVGPKHTDSTRDIIGTRKFPVL